MALSKTSKKKYVGRRFKKRDKLATRTYVKKLIRKDVETKYIDAQWPTGGYRQVDWSATHTFQVLTAMGQSTTDVTRIGDKVTLRSIHIRLQFAFPGSPFPTNPLRLVVFQWHPTSSLVAPTPSRILVPAYLGTINAPSSPFIHDYDPNYTILVDKYFSLTVENPANVIKHIRVRLKYAKKTIAFDAGSLDAANHVYAMLLTDSAVGSASILSLMIARVFYDDA